MRPDTHAGRVRPVEHDRAFIAGRRDATAFARASRHSRRVRLLKIGLPVGGLVALLLMAAAFRVTGFAHNAAEFAKLRVEDGKLVMNKPELNGVDSNKRPFHLTARKAVQDADRPTVVALEELKARVALDDKSFAAIVAGAGSYDADAKTLRLEGNVAVDTDDGTTIRMEDADIDIDKGDLTTMRPVTVDTGRMFVSSDTLQVTDSGKRIIFETNVRMTIRPQDARPAKASLESAAAEATAGITKQ